MKHDPHQRIREAIETGYGGLKGDAYLAGRIVQERSGRRQKLRLAMALMTLLIVVTSVAFALKPRRYAVENSGTWTYVDNQILYQGAEEKRPSVVLEKEGVRNMAVDNVTGMLYYITRAKGGGYTLDNLTSYGQALYPSRHINGKYLVIQDIIVDGGTMYMLADTSTAKGEIYWLDAYSEKIPDSKISIPGWENRNTTSFALWDDVLYAYNASTMELAAIDLRRYELLNAPVVAGDLTAIAAGYELDGERYVLAISGEKLVAVSCQSGKKRDTGVELPAGSSSLARNSYTLHVADSAGTLIADYHITDLSGREMRQLYIVDGFPGGPVYETAEALFHEKYPDVEIVHRWTNGGIDYRTEMMSGEDGIDIVCFQDYYASESPLPQLLRSGAIVDLTDVPEIAALREHYLDIWELVSTNGRQYGMMDVTYADHFMWEVDPEVAARIGWEIPEGVWTWDEFDEAMALAIAYNETAEKPVQLMIDVGKPGYGVKQFDAIYLDFFTGTTNYDSEEYLKVIQREQKLEMYGLRPQYNYSVNALDGNTLFRVSCIGSQYKLGDKDFILPPAYDAENPQYLASIMPLVVNANSKMKEEAIYFLACFGSPEATSKNSPYWGSVWLKDQSLYSDVTDPIILQMEGPGASEKNAALQTFQQEHAIPTLQIIEIWRMQLRELQPRLAAGEITPEEYVAIVQRQADMIMGE